MYITFENEAGKIQLGGGADPFYKTLSIIGLGLPVKNVSVIEHVHMRGQVLVCQKDVARVITIAGDICKRGELRQEIARFTKILYKEGFLKLRFGSKKRMIKCRCTDFEDPKRTGPYATFVMQFTADDPAFTDFDIVKQHVFKRENMIEGTYALPMVMTKRISGAQIINYGEIETFPLFYLTSNLSGAASDDVVVIKNETTGSVIELGYTPGKDETVCIDVENARVTSNVKTEQNHEGNLIYEISDRTFLTDFCLVPGVNQITAACDNSSLLLHVVCEYYNRYIEAVY